MFYSLFLHFFFQAEDGIRSGHVTGVQTCALPISTSKEHTMALKIIVGGDNAGFGYKEELKALLEGDDRVESVFDVGVGSRSEERRVGEEGRCWWERTG